MRWGLFPRPWPGWADTRGSGLSVITMEGGLEVWVEALIGRGFDVWVEAQQILGEGMEKKSVRRLPKSVIVCRPQSGHSS